MTAQTFVAAIEKYYGAYSNQFKRDMVTKYAEKIPVPELNVILTILIESVSDQYKSVPDVATISKVRSENESEIAQKSGGVWRDQLNGKYWLGETYLGYMDGHTFIPNTMLQDREKIGYICNPLNAEHYVLWLREQKLLPSEDAIEVAMIGAETHD